MVFWTRNYCMLNDKGIDGTNIGEEVMENKIITKNYEYTCVFEFNGKAELSPFIHLTAKGVCPTIRISNHTVNFGSCSVGSHKDFLVTLENKNEEHPIDFNFSIVAHFKVNPRKGRLLPHQSTAIVFTFEPNNMGKFVSYMTLELFGLYKIPIKLMGAALSQTSKLKGTRGIESLPEDFTVEKNFVGEGNNGGAGPDTKKIKKPDRLIFTATGGDRSSMMMTMQQQFEGTGASEKMDYFYAMKNNRSKYNNFLKE